MSAELPPAVARFYASFEDGDVEALDEAFHPEWFDHTLPPGRAPGVAGMKAAVLALRAAVPDLRFAREKTLSDGDEIVVHGRFSGTHAGAFGPFAATGGPVDFIIFDLHRLADGRIVESWHLEDNLTVLTQMGAIPALG